MDLPPFRRELAKMTFNFRANLEITSFSITSRQNCSEHARYFFTEISQVSYFRQCCIIRRDICQDRTKIYNIIGFLR